MNRQKENIDFLMRRVLLIFFFLFILFTFKNTDCRKGDSFNSFVSFETVIEIDNSAIPVESISHPDFNNSLVSCELFSSGTSDNNRFRIICSSIKMNLLFRIGTERFLSIKPRLIDVNTCLFLTSSNDGDIPLIS